MVFLGGCVSYMCSGMWIKYAGFIPPYWMVFSCEIVAALYGIFFLKESKPKLADISADTAKPNCVHNLKQTVSVLTQPRKEGPLYLPVLLVCESLHAVCTMGLSGVMILLALDAPFCMSSVLVGYFLAFRMFLIGVGAVVGLKFLPLCKLRQPTIAFFGVASMIISAFAMGLAKNIPTLFLSKS